MNIISTCTKRNRSRI